MREQRAHEVALGREVVLEVAHAHAGALGDVAQGELLVALVREHGLRGRDDVGLARPPFLARGLRRRNVPITLAQVGPSGSGPRSRRRGLKVVYVTSRRFANYGRISVS